MGTGVLKFHEVSPVDKITGRSQQQQLKFLRHEVKLDTESPSRAAKGRTALSRVGNESAKETLKRRNNEFLVDFIKRSQQKVK